MSEDLHNLTVPRLHMNGSSGHSLFEQYGRARESLYATIQAIEGPNARDYYVIDDQAFKKAQAEHRSRMQRLNGVLDEITTIQYGIAEQQRLRDRNRGCGIAA